MEKFLVPGFILSLVFNCLWILGIANSNIHVVFKIFWSLLLIIIFTFVFAFMFQKEDTEWNGGYCIRCGTAYQAISYNRGSTRYECPNCHYAMSK